MAICKKKLKMPHNERKLVVVIINTKGLYHTYVSKYNAVLSRRHFDIGFDVTKVVGSQDYRLRLLYQLEVS